MGLNETNTPRARAFAMRVAVERFGMDCTADATIIRMIADLYEVCETRGMDTDDVHRKAMHEIRRLG